MHRPDQGAMRSDPRRNRLLAVIEEVARRRASGEFLADSQVLSDHFDLLPELSSCLAALQQVEHARAAAIEPNQHREPAMDDRARRSVTSDLVIPGYELQGEIHRGGQGIVFRALQESTGRKVAVKLLHSGPFSGSRDVARFQREVQILARLRHPNIVTIHDSGVSQGRHYFVMDLVEGRPLDEAVRAAGWPLRQTVSVLAKVCDAVAAAHQQGVIHRDLKPGNILLDHRDEPRVLDFGLARSLSGMGVDAARWTTITQSEQFVGSLPWASPEQITPSLSEVDLRSDVYSLGVVFYQALTGGFPYDVRGDLRLALSNIAEAVPPRPRALRRELDSDLERIILTCLEKEPARRYQNAIDLRDDLERYLRHEPVRARAPSRVYQFRKLVRRHRMVFSLTTAMLVLTIAFSARTLVLNAQLKRALNAAVAAQDVAETQSEAARRESRTHAAVRHFLIDDMLMAAEPGVALGRDSTASEMAARARERIGSRFDDEPLIRASILTTLGQVHRSLGKFSEAVVLLRQADELYAASLDSLSDEWILARQHLGSALLEDGQVAAAAALVEGLCARLEDHLGPNGGATLEVRYTLAAIRLAQGRTAEAMEAYRDVFDQALPVLGEDHPVVISARAELAVHGGLDGQGPAAAAEALRAAYEAVKRRFGADHPTTLHFAMKLASIPSERGGTDEALATLRATLDDQIRILGDDHPDVQLTRVQLAGALERYGALHDAVAMCELAVKKLRAGIGSEHQKTLGTMDRLGYLKAAVRDYRSALRIHKEVLDARLRTLGTEHYATANSLEHYGGSLSRLGRTKEAVEALRSALETRIRLNEPREQLVGVLRGLVSALGEDGRPEDARPFAMELLELRRVAAERADAGATALNCYARELVQVFPEQLRQPALAVEYAERAKELTPNAYPYNRYVLALALEADGRPEEAVAPLAEALARTTLDESDFREQYEIALLRILDTLDQSDEAEAYLRRTLAARRARANAVPGDVTASLDQLGALLIEQGRSVEAAELLRESLELRLSNAQSDWRLARCMGLLGVALMETDPVEGRSLIDAAQQLVNADPYAPKFSLRDVQPWAANRRTHTDGAAIVEGP